MKIVHSSHVERFNLWAIVAYLAYRADEPVFMVAAGGYALIHAVFALLLLIEKLTGE